MPCRYRAAIPLVAGIALSACMPLEADSVSSAAPTSVVPAAGDRHAPQDRLLLDFRGKWWDTPQVAEAERRRIVKLLDPGATIKAQVTSSIEGAFTSVGARERAVMLVPDGPSTVTPFPEPATLAIIDGDRLVARHTFAKEEPPWQWIRAAADTDGDGIDELLLGSGYVQMGEQATSLLVASVADGRYRSGTRFENVAYSDCGAHDDRSRGKVEAAVIAIEGGKLVEHRHRAPCAPNANAEGAYPDPAPADYRPVP